MFQTKWLPQILQGLQGSSQGSRQNGTESSSPALHFRHTLSYVHCGLREGFPSEELGAHSLEGLKILNPQVMVLFTWILKVFVLSLSLPHRHQAVTNLSFSHLTKAAGFHGYLQAHSKVAFLEGPGLGK